MAFRPQSLATFLLSVMMLLARPVTADGLDTPAHAASNPPRPAPVWIMDPVRAPRVSFRVYESRAAKARVGFHVYTPETYDFEKTNRLPVLYWLHGSGGGRPGIAPMSAFFDRAIRDGLIPPMIIVFPDGHASSMWCDSKDGVVPMETMVVKELVPHIDATMRTRTNRGARLLEGFSMGGYGAARLGFKYPELFGAVSLLAGGPLDLDFAGPRATGNPGERERILRETWGGDLDDYHAKSPWHIASENAQAVRGNVIVRLVVGDLDNTAPLSRAFSAHLKALNIAHTFTVIPGVDHKALGLLVGLGAANWEFYRGLSPR